MSHISEPSKRKFVVIAGYRAVFKYVHGIHCHDVAYFETEQEANEFISGKMKMRGRQ